jgi:transposase
VVLEDKAATSVPGLPVIVVDLSHGRRVSIFSSASPAMAAAVVEVLAR